MSGVKRMTEQRFTDEDLKRLKDTLADPDQNLDWMYAVRDGFVDDKYKALVRRLEAAEKALQLRINGFGGFVFEDAVEAWRRVSGK